MLREITPRQFRNWRHYYELEPFGERLADYRVGHIVQALYNIARDTKAHPKPLPLEPFIPAFGDYGDIEEAKKPIQRQTWQEQKQWAKLFTKAFNSKDAKD